MNRETPKSFEVYKHFKGKYYMILAVGIGSFPLPKLPIKKIK